MLESIGVAFTNKVIYYYLLRSSSIEGEFNPSKIKSGLAVTALMEAHSDLLKPIEKAYRCRKLSLYYHLLIPTPKGAEGRDVMVDYIKKNHYSIVLLNLHYLLPIYLLCQFHLVL